MKTLNFLIFLLIFFLDSCSIQKTNKELTGVYINDTPSPHWRPLRNLFKTITQNDKYIYIQNKNLILYDDSTFNFFYSGLTADYFAGQFEVKKKSLILKYY